jgi:DNA-binding MarR family transcriptional regulator
MMGTMDESERDIVDQHVARWDYFWKDNPAYAAEVEGALVRMGHILRQSRREDAAAFAGSDFTIEDYKTLHVLMVQPYPTEATPAQLAEAAHVTRSAMTSRLDRLVTADLVTREVDAADRRRVLVRPTAAGRAAWDHYIYEGMAREQHLLRALSLDELTRLNALLRKVLLSIEP